MRIFHLLLALCLITSGLTAQDKNAESYSVRLQGDTHVIPMPVIDRKKDKNVSVLFSDGTLFKSDNEGETWNKEKINNTQGSEESWLFSNKKGDLFRIEKTSSDIIESAVSDDHGSTWKRLGKLEMPFIQGDPRLFFDPDRERMAVTYVKNEDCSVNLMFVHSSNSRKFDDPVPLIRDGVDCKDIPPTQPDIIIDPRDYLFATWAQGESIFMDRSYNDGETWLRSDIMIRKRAGQRGRPMLAVDRSESVLKGAMYVVWTDSVAEGSMLKCSRSTNNGDVWTSGSAVHPNVAQLHAAKVKIDQSNGFLFVLYFIASGESAWDLMLAFSDDGGQTFKPTRVNTEPLLLTDEMLEMQIADLDVYGGKMLLVWSSASGEEQQFRFRALSFTDLQKAEGQLD